MHQALQKLPVCQKHPPIFSEYFGKTGHSLVIRTLNLTLDIPLLYSWLKDPAFLTNRDMRDTSDRLQIHYRKFIESENRQSFLIEKAGVSFFQFDIYLIHDHELYFRIPTTTGDCILHFLVLFKKELKQDMANAIGLMIDYFYHYPDCRRIWLPVPDQEEGLKELFIEAGFKYRASYTSKQRRYALYFLKRKDFLAAGQPIVNIPDTE